MSVPEPSKILTPWATSGLKNSIPQTSNPATGNAGYDQGFPAINMTAKEAGGIPPFGQDFNGIFFDITEILQYMQAGGHPTYSSSLASSIGGYPLGAMLAKTSGIGFWRNIVENNTSNPDVGGTGWVSDSIGSYGSATAISAASTSLTSGQVGQAFIFTMAGSSVSLPIASSCPSGSVFSISSTSGTVLNVTGGGSFFAGSSSVSSWSITQGTEVAAISNGSSWYVFGSGTSPLPIGFSQSWQDLTASRALGTTYTNTTGRTIAIAVGTTSNTSSTISATIAGVALPTATYQVGGGVFKANTFALVPGGATYSVSGASLEKWVELR